MPAMVVAMVVATVAAGYDGGGVATITVEGCVDRWSGDVTGRGMLRRHGDRQRTRPSSLRDSIYHDYYVRVRGTSGLEILLNFICVVLLSLPPRLLPFLLSPFPLLDLADAAAA